MATKMYEHYINSVKKNVRKWLDKVAPNAPEEKKDRFARALSTVLFLGAEYGAGDAFAGLLLRKILPRDAIKHLHKSLEWLGVKNLPEPKVSFNPCFYAMKLLEADYGDEEMNKLVKELDRFSLSGGRYVPKFLGDKDD